MTIQVTPREEIVERPEREGDEYRFKVEVNTYGDPEDSWATNAMVYSSQSEAIDAAKDLFMRWTAVRKWRVVDLLGNVIEGSD